MSEQKILKIGKKEIDYSWISVERTLKAIDIYNQIIKLGNRSDSKVVSIMVDAVIVLIRRDFSFSLDYFKRLLITKKYILKHLNYKELDAFMEIALEPILGDKKSDKRTTGSGGSSGKVTRDEPRSIETTIAECCCIYGWRPDYIYKKLSIEELFMYYKVGYKYDHIKRGFTFKDEMSEEKADEKREELKKLYPEWRGR